MQYNMASNTITTRCRQCGVEIKMKPERFLHATLREKTLCKKCRNGGKKHDRR